MYLYRFDPIDRLRGQANDPVLRARRVREATGQFDHHQAITALKTLADGNGVYRFCFWKTWEAAVRHFPLIDHPNGSWIMQRIKIDHSVLKQFHRGDDEYLAEDAWIYWHCSEIDDERPDWSHVGISHADIEVLNPGGLWEMLGGSVVLSDDDIDGWDAQFLTGLGGSVCPYYARALARRVDSRTEVWVVIRQKYGPWTSLLNSDQLLALSVSNQLHKIGELRHDQVRWVVAGEFSDRVLAYEFFPRITMQSTVTGLKAWLLGMAGVEVGANAACLVAPQRRPLDLAEIVSLYRDFGVGHVLRHQQRWRYADHFLLGRQEPS